MTVDNIRVKGIRQVDERTVGLLWTDGREDQLDVVLLRRKCPCAACVDEITRAPILRPEDVKDTVRPLRIESVGSYALKVFFDDGHSTGIYTFQHLRKLAEEAGTAQVQH